MSKTIDRVGCILGFCYHHDDPTCPYDSSLSDDEKLVKIHAHYQERIREAIDNVEQTFIKFSSFRHDNAVAKQVCTNLKRELGIE